MGFNFRLVNNYLATGTTATTAVTAGTTIGGNTLPMINVANSSLSATVTTLAETNTLTLAAKWQVSNDNSTWNDCVDMNNVAATVMSTGTAGTDTAVTKVLSAPHTVYGWRFARMSIVTGVTTAGASVDTYAISYNFLKADTF